MEPVRLKRRSPILDWRRIGLQGGIGYRENVVLEASPRTREDKHGAGGDAIPFVHFRDFPSPSFPTSVVITDIIQHLGPCLGVIILLWRVPVEDDPLHP